MQIHVVQEGDTLYGIAEAYNTTPSAIASTNDIDNPNELVVGQSLVIPIVGSFYWVQPGDTLFSISNKVGVSVDEIAQINGLYPYQELQPGLRLYIPTKPKVSKEINAYIEPFGEEVKPELLESANKNSQYLTYLAPFSYEVQRDGSLKSPTVGNLPDIAEANGATLMMVVTNLEDGAFSDELGKIILTDEEVQDKLLENIISTAKEYNFSDVHFDFEYLPSDLRENYNDFLRKAKEKLSAEGLLMSTALAPKTSSEQVGQWYEAHDYKAHGEIADFVVLMTYEWGWSGGPPLPVSPIDPVTEVVDYALSVIPAEKIMLGQNLYGYDWTLPYVEGGEFAKAVSPQRAIELARENNVPIGYDYNYQAPFIDYVDSEGKEHKVWFEDAQSIQTKLNLVKDKGLRGISYWKLGFPFPQNWLLVEDNFDVVKR